MVKKVLIFSLISILFSVFGYFTNNFILDSNQITIGFSLITVYSFYCIAAILIYAFISAAFDFVPNETGYLFLVLLMIKMGVFILIFKDHILSEPGLTSAEKASILLPMLCFLVLETVGITKVLNSK